MDEKKWPELEDDFRTWSGGFSPESDYQVVAYLDYTSPFPDREDQVRRYLMDWCNRGDPD